MRGRLILRLHHMISQRNNPLGSLKNILIKPYMIGAKIIQERFQLIP